jgi:hypothetical protein
MTLQRRDFLLVMTLAAAAATPAFGQAVAPTVWASQWRQCRIRPGFLRHVGPRLHPRL